ncbi:hypothetical protein D5R81_07785 [Parashewanella spongiae]|uniref:Uncharacterized protein n=1 Tax=Parashewanella spongiae TaxID=342950 RepID=A0A3A6TTV7_9GAMM|nr:hypothetical protein [Parashewanella spongiae]MCL1077085.1 hypothetical protein [Parashewanella spongiae]RJY17679.1 hypothetical protein D5R81_07785 [Parashewanella spongiae]
MTTIIGYCYKDGAFLAADSRRIDVDTKQPHQNPVKKVVQLTDKIIIATGGLGSYGHKAREMLIKSIYGKNLHLEDLILAARMIFDFQYKESFKQAPDHRINLVCILAGQDEHNEGFICSISSLNNFTPHFKRGHGAMFHMGTDTSNLIKTSEHVLSELRKTNQKLMLDNWAIETLKQVCVNDTSTGFPIQLISAKQKIIDNFPIDEDFQHIDEFQTEFPI